MMDTISDGITRIRNAGMVGHTKVNVISSELMKNLLNVLKEEGYIEGFEVNEDNRSFLVHLKYYQGKHAITEIKRVSKCGRRVYSSVVDLKKVANGLGISILSTSNGVLSDRKAVELNAGGEVICSVF